MAGLIVAISEAPQGARAIVDRGLAQMRHFPWLRVHRYDDPHFSMALVLPEHIAPTLWGDDGNGRHAAVHGEYYPDDAPIEDADNAIRQLVTRARTNNAECLVRDNGIFNIVIWDSRRRTCTLVNDVLGPLLLFRRRMSRALLCASEPGALQAADEYEALDDAGLESLLRIGYQADHRTGRRGVDVMPPATVMHWQVDNGGIRERVSQSTSTLPAITPYAEHFVPALESAVRLRARERLHVLMSGGEDSRWLTSIAQRLHLQFTTSTLDGCQVRDAEVATRIAQQLSVANHVVPIDPTALAANIEFMKAAFATTMDWHAAVNMPLFRACPEGATLMLGFLGGTLAGTGIARDAADATGAAQLAAAEAHYCAGQSASPWGQAPCVPLAPRAFPIQAATQLPGELLVHLYGRQRRYTSYTLRLAWNFARPVCPFADRRLIALSLALDRRALYLRRARQIEYRKHFPELAQTIISNDLLPAGQFGLRAARARLRGTWISRAVRRLMPAFPVTYQAERLRPMLTQAVATLPEAQRDQWLQAYPSCSVFEGFSLLAVAVCAPEYLMRLRTRPRH